MIARERSAAWGGLWLGLLLVCGCAEQPRDDPARRLHELFEREWSARLAEDPLLATSVGRHEYDHRLPAVGPAAQERRFRIWRGFLAELRAIDPADLDENDRISHAIFARQLSDRLAGYEFGTYQVPITSDSGFHTELARLPAQVPLATTADYDTYLARLRELPRYLDEQIANMRAGLERGMTIPRAVLDGYESSLRPFVVEDPTASVFYGPFRDLPHGVPAGQHEALRARGAEVIARFVVPAYAAFLRFMVDEYIPGARTSLGASELPRGREYYADRVRHYTTLDDRTPQQIHDLGLREVERIRGEMQAIVDDVGAGARFAEFVNYLRRSPRFYAKTADELLMRAAWIAKRMDARLPSLFKTFPRLPYGVEPVPSHLAPRYTAGRYIPAPHGSARPGYYWVNTHRLRSRPLYALEALTLHEAVPGHHFQIALNNELAHLPDFRRFSYIPAFGEGWALYAESLGREVGFYEDPYSDFGRLTYEMWRACRLVVDTGIHAFGWTREQGRAFLADNTALSLHEIRTEVDRYVSWPAQALAYKIGELEIRALRERAERALGDRFDLREFHDALLRHGAVPLPVLRSIVERHVEQARAAEEGAAAAAQAGAPIP